MYSFSHVDVGSNRIFNLALFYTIETGCIIKFTSYNRVDTAFLTNITVTCYDISFVLHLYKWIFIPRKTFLMFINGIKNGRHFHRISISSLLWMKISHNSCAREISDWDWIEAAIGRIILQNVLIKLLAIGNLTIVVNWIN